MKDYQKRVIEEKRELNKKIITLTKYLFSGLSADLTDRDRKLLEKQLFIMLDYSIILNQRIDTFI